MRGDDDRPRGNIPTRPTRYAEIQAHQLQGDRRCIPSAPVIDRGVDGNYERVQAQAPICGGHQRRKDGSCEWRKEES